MATIPPPDHVLPEAAVRTAEEQLKYGNQFPYSSYVASETTSVAEAASRLEYVRARYARDGADGYAALAMTLARGQTYNTGFASRDPAVAGTFRDAFGALVAAGTWTAADTKGIVEAEASHRTGVMDAHALGTYFTALHGPGAEATRADFVRESVAQGRALDNRTPGAGVALYAQAAQVLGSMPAPELVGNLDALRRSNPNAISEIAYGSMGGTAQLATNLETGNRVHPGVYSADGLGRMIGTLADAKAQTQLVDAVHGVSLYLTDHRESAAEDVLLRHDRETGLRSALERASAFEPGGRSNFSALLRANSDATGLSGQLRGDGGFDLVENLGRTELGNAAHDPTALRFRDSVGRVIGDAAVDLAVSTTQQDARLRADFGNGTFGGTTALLHEMSAARTLGNILNQLNAGIDHSFDAVNERSAQNQETLKGMFETIGSTLSTAAKLGGPAAERLETLASVAEGIADQIPRDRVLTSEATKAYIKQLGGGVDDLLNRRPELQAQFKAGVDDSSAWVTDVDTTIGAARKNEEADRSGTFVGRRLRDIVAPQPVEPVTHEPTKTELLDGVRAAVKTYNADPAHGRRALLEPASEGSVRSWGEDGSPKRALSGTLLELEAGGEREYALYAVHNGRGTYTVLDSVRDLVGADPHTTGRDGSAASLVGHEVTLQPNGIVMPAAAPHAHEHAPAR